MRETLKGTVPSVKSVFSVDSRAASSWYITPWSVCSLPTAGTGIMQTSCKHSYGRSWCVTTRLKKGKGLMTSTHRKRFLMVLLAEQLNSIYRLNRDLTATSGPRPWCKCELPLNQYRKQVWQARRDHTIRSLTTGTYACLSLLLNGKWLGRTAVRFFYLWSNLSGFPRLGVFIGWYYELGICLKAPPIIPGTWCDLTVSLRPHSSSAPV